MGGVGFQEFSPILSQTLPHLRLIEYRVCVFSL